MGYNSFETAVIQQIQTNAELWQRRPNT